MTNKIQILADILGMPVEHVHEALEAHSMQKHCKHNWVLTWPLDPEEYTCSKCGVKTLR